MRGRSVSLLVGLALAAVGVLVAQVTAPGLAIVPVVAGPLGESAPCAVISVRTWKILGHFLLRYLFMQFPMPFLLWYPAWDLRYRPAFGICVAAFCASVSGPASMLRLGVWRSSLAQWEVGRPPHVCMGVWLNSSIDGCSWALIEHEALSGALNRFGFGRRVLTSGSWRSASVCVSAVWCAVCCSVSLDGQRGYGSSCP